MSKKIKAIIISAVAVVSAFGVATGTVFIKYPMSPKVEIKSSEERIKDNDKLLVASYNTAAPWGSLLKGTHTDRRAHLFAQQINDCLPDVLGVQELNTFWEAKFEELLPQYEHYGIKRGGDDKERTSEINAIYYLKDKFELLESDTFWISLTPDQESRFEGAGCHRICSYVVLKNKATGKITAHLNTHLDNVSVAAQDLGGDLINQKATELGEKYDDLVVIVTGDFNQYENGIGVSSLTDSGFINSSSTVENGNSLTTYHGWGKDIYPEAIDFILVKNATNVMNYKNYEVKYDDSYVSDHYMISAEVEL